MKISSYQVAVTLWMQRCFGAEISADKVERNYRFLEEALELVQAGGCSKEDALRLVDYVYDRPVGQLSQEVGGVSVTLAALCQANGISWEASAEDEYRRINAEEVLLKIREKQKSKPQKGPLPGRVITSAGAECNLPYPGFSPCGTGRVLRIDPDWLRQRFEDPEPGIFQAYQPPEQEPE